VLKEFYLSFLSKILIVDDSAAIHQTYKITLLRYKCDTLFALSGPEGLNQLSSNSNINLIIIDINMPHMGGIEFIKRVRAQESFSKIPIIAVISKGKSEDSLEAIHLAEGILKKPFTSTEIHLEIEKLFPESVLESKAVQ
jgi:CheY-like chemotaxis protein